MDTQLWRHRETLQALLRQHGHALVSLAIALAFIPLALKYGHETQRILGLVSDSGGIDLGFYHRWTQQWFSGINVYLANRTPQGYPPASIVMLYPLIGWLTMPQARWVWAITTIASFIVIAAIALHATDAKNWRARAAIIILLLLINGTSVTYGNGQASLHVLALLLSAILILHPRPIRWQTDLVCSALFLGALVKPNLSAPFVWLLIFFPNTIHLRPIILISVGYAALSLFAAQVLRTPLLDLAQQFLATRIAHRDTFLDPNVHFLFDQLGLRHLALPASAIILGALGVWVYRHRQDNLWRLLAVTTLVTRFWGFHWMYDNVLLIIPEIALIQILKCEAVEPNQKIAAAILLALNVLVMLPPGNLGGQSQTVQVALMLSQGAVWGATLIFFLMHARVTAKTAK